MALVGVYFGAHGSAALEKLQLLGHNEMRAELATSQRMTDQLQLMAIAQSEHTRTQVRPERVNVRFIAASAIRDAVCTLMKTGCRRLKGEGGLTREGFLCVASRETPTRHVLASAACGRRSS
eukprot:6193294-Pleurochrysis_carterae.AAC.1